MLKEERHKIIINLINQKGILTVHEAVKTLNVSDMTVRRDLIELENNNAIKRVHGGAISASDHKLSELSHTQKQEMHIEEKISIAQKASTLIEDGDSIFLGTGTTTELLIDYIEADSVFILTNSLPVFNKVVSSNLNANIYLIGGNYREKTGAFIGSFSVEIAGRMSVNKAFIGANGIKNNGIYTANIEEGTILKTILDNANQRILLADHDKFNTDDLFKFDNLSNFDYLITDSDYNENFINEYKKHVQIIKSNE